MDYPLHSKISNTTWVMTQGHSATSQRLLSLMESHPYSYTLAAHYPHSHLICPHLHRLLPLTLPHYQGTSRCLSWTAQTHGVRPHGCTLATCYLQSHVTLPLVLRTTPFYTTSIAIVWIVSTFYFLIFLYQYLWIYFYIIIWIYSFVFEIINKFAYESFSNKLWICFLMNLFHVKLWICFHVKLWVFFLWIYFWMNPWICILMDLLLYTKLWICFCINIFLFEYVFVWIYNLFLYESIFEWKYESIFV